MQTIMQKVCRIWKKSIFASLMPTQKVRLYWCINELNFGDALNKNLMKFFDIKYTYCRPKYAQLTAIGSLLEKYLKDSSKTKKPMHIFGSGFIASQHHKNESFYRPMIFHAIRGKLSYERCQKIMNDPLENVVLGDPGLLIRRMFPSIQKTSHYDVGIICHYVDQNSPLLKHIDLKNLKVKIINVMQEPENFVKEVAQCSFVLSSAMHGLICADSLGIPNKHIILGNNVSGGEYKYRDYYSVFSYFKYNPVYLKNTLITEKEIQKYKTEYNIKSADINQICDRLIKAFPKPESF